MKALNTLEKVKTGQTVGDQAVIPERTESKKSVKTSSAVLAMIAFLVINALLSVTQPLVFDKFQFPYKGWAWWLMKDLNHSSTDYNLAFLGSSLTVSALNSADATHYKENLDLTLYHKTRYFDSLLKEKTGTTINSFNLSTPGQMPSDALLTIQAMISTGKKPELVIYAVAPRDFIDSELAGPQDTEPFTYLSRVVNIDTFEDKIFSSNLDKINRTLQKNIYFYKNAIDLQMELGKYTTSMIDWLAPEPNKQKPFTYWDRTKLLPEYKKGEFHPFANMCNPTDLSKPSEYNDNSIEYVHRYKKPNPQAFETQMYFLKELSNFCEKNQIGLVLINMPITDDNMKLLKKEHYDKYMTRLNGFASQGKVEFFDMNDHSIFVKPDFHDGVHMNARGGIKFIERLVERLTNSKKVKAKLNWVDQVPNTEALSQSGKSMYSLDREASKTND